MKCKKPIAHRPAMEGVNNCKACEREQIVFDKIECMVCGTIDDDWAESAGMIVCWDCYKNSGMVE